MRRGAACLLVVGLAGCGARARVTRPSGGADAAWAALADGRAAEARAAFDARLETHPRDGRALYGRALIAHESGALLDAWNLWLRLLEAAETPDLAIAAARRLETLHGEAPGLDPVKEAERLAKLDLSRLQPETRRRVRELGAILYRRAGREAEARALDRASGCPDRWFVAGPYGRLPRLDLERAFPVEQGGDAAKLRAAPSRACQVTLDAPLGRPGVVYAIAWAKAEREQVVSAVVTAVGPWRLFVDGVEAASQLAEDVYPARVRVVPVQVGAGWHRVMLKIAAPGGRADVELALDAAPALSFHAGAAAEAPRTSGRVVGLAGSAETVAEGDPLAVMAALERALAMGDSAAAETAVARLSSAWPKLAPAWLLAAQAALEDPGRPSNIAQDRARRALERALSIDPTLVRARYTRAMMSLGAERPREALQRLEAAPPGGRAYWRFAYARWQALKARGFQREAEAALVEARALHPDACAALEAEIGLRREKHDVKGTLELARKARHCGGGSDELAEALREAGDLKGAIAEYERLLALDPAREPWRSGLAETLEHAGDLRGAAAIFRALVERYPRSSHYRLKLADVLVGLGEEAAARRTLEDGLAELPESQELQRAVEALCSGRDARCGPIDSLRVDGRTVIADYLAEAKRRPPYTSPAVIVLDRTVTRVFPTGARLTITHNIIQVLAKDGIDKWGEVQIPEGADVLTLRTVKADGTTREPEQILEKETVSVPDLEVGDFVEFEYVDPSPPPGAFPGGFFAERFYFRSFDAPLDRTEYVLVTPKDLPLALDARGGPPEAQLEVRGDLAVRTFAARRMPQAFQEPASAPFAEFMPSVRAASGVSFEGWRDYLRDGAFETTRTNAELRALARKLTAGATTPEAKVAALDGWVRRHIKPGGGLDERATSILARAAGSRVTLLKALLGAVGLPSEIWLARPQSAAVLDGALPDLEAYDQPVLFVPALGRVVDPRYRHSPTGFVTPLLRGGRALRLAPGATHGTIAPEAADDRRMEITAELDPDGGAEVSIKETLRGWPAVEWREALEKLPPDRVRPEFEQRTLGFYFPGASLIDLKWSGASDDEAPFVVEYRFRSPQLARKIGGQLVLPAPFPAMLGRRYVGVAARKTPLVLEYASPTQILARVSVPRGARLELPPPQKAEEFGLFEQSAESEEGGFVLRARFAMPRQRVDADKYRAFVDFATRVDRAEARAATLSAGK